MGRGGGVALQLEVGERVGEASEAEVSLTRRLKLAVRGLRYWARSWVGIHFRAITKVCVVLSLCEVAEALDGDSSLLSSKLNG